MSFSPDVAFRAKMKPILLHNSWPNVSYSDPLMAAASRTYERLTVVEVLARWDNGLFCIWSGNRHLVESRAARIAVEVERNKDFGPMPIIIGCITSGERRNGFVVDGQHRLHAARLLSSEAAARTELCLCWEECKNELDLRALFRRVNCGTPVPPSHWDEDVYTFCKDVAREIRKKWSADIVKDTNTCQRPRVTFRALREAIDECRDTREAAAANKLSAANAIATLIHMNTIHERMFTGESGKRARADEKVSEDMLGIAIRYKFYIGLRKNWLCAFLAELSEQRVAND
jgi:hypothetical protein